MKGGNGLGLLRLQRKKKEFGFNSKCDEAPLHGCRWGNIGSGVL